MALLQPALSGRTSVAQFFAAVERDAGRIGPGTDELLRILKPVLGKIEPHRAEEAVMLVVNQVNKSDVVWSEAVPQLTPKPTSESAASTRNEPIVLSKRKVDVKHTFGLFRHEQKPETVVIKPEESGGNVARSFRFANGRLY